ncbi:TPA: DUF4868 domain-containing protein [Campylobacter lari]|uniref:anti-phage protein KwaB n=1 Tax=Campylobacter sp. IFREMER_LSEM_CL1890 TaxID=2911615 RepID=UPI001418D04C|nr:anti-phage protein KwaB [Campylobacter sp. IFREMER_LSEM_CL1890]EDP6879963.1 DUF4868 domain-containing protein [Campylobacter lari]MCV3409398.1 DUF4868 domain-containing protein [Campylobacter sp. IFREMER_LSEM_CL1890]HEC1797195.1 DUF4868 domain-containing protein [Campylobacter lari]
MIEIKNDFKEFSNKDRDLLGAVLFAVTKTNEVYKVDLESNAVVELRNMILDVLDGIVNNEDMSFMDISAVDDRKDVVCVYDEGLALPEDLAEIQARLNNESNLEDMDFTQIQMNDIKMFIVHTGIDIDRLYLYQFVSNVNIYGRDKFFFKKDKHRLMRIDDDMVRITSKIHMAQLGDKLAIFELEQFEKIFKFHDVIKQEATSCMNKIQEMQLIENIEDFKSIVNDAKFTRKIIRAIRNSPVIKLGISNKQIIDFCMNYKSIAGKLKLNDDKDKLILDTKKSKDIFLNVMLDNFLSSELTKLYYESRAKDEIISDSEKES